MQPTYKWAEGRVGQEVLDLMQRTRHQDELTTGADAQQQMTRPGVSRSRPFVDGGMGDVMLNMRALDHLEEWLIATLIAGATALIFFAVLHRYGTGLSIDLSKWADARTASGAAGRLARASSWFAALDVSWAQELCIFMFVWMAKFGAAYGVRTGVHVGVDVVVNQLPRAVAQEGDPVRPSVRRVLHLRSSARSAPASWPHMFETGQQSNDLEAPMWIVYPAIPLGSDLMCFRFLQVAGRSPDRRTAAHRREPRRGHRRRSDALHPVEPTCDGDACRAAGRTRSALALIMAPILILAICLASQVSA